MNNLARMLSALLDAKNLNQSSLSEVSGIDRTRINRMLSGNPAGRIGHKTLIVILDALDLRGVDRAEVVREYLRDIVETDIQLDPSLITMKVSNGQTDADIEKTLEIARHYCYAKPTFFEIIKGLVSHEEPSPKQTRPSG